MEDEFLLRSIPLRHLERSCDFAERHRKDLSKPVTAREILLAWECLRLLARLNFLEIELYEKHHGVNL